MFSTLFCGGATYILANNGENAIQLGMGHPVTVNIRFTATGALYWKRDNGEVKTDIIEIGDELKNIIVKPSTRLGNTEHTYFDIVNGEWTVNGVCQEAFDLI